MPEPLLGPVEVLAVAFPERRVPEHVQQTVARTLASGAVRLVDLVVIRMSDAGQVEVLEMDELDDELDVAEFEASHPGLAGQEDVDHIVATMAPGTSAVLLVLEQTWAREIVQATEESGAVLLTSEWIPAAVANELVKIASVQDASAT